MMLMVNTQNYVCYDVDDKTLKVYDVYGDEECVEDERQKLMVVEDDGNAVDENYDGVDKSK